MRDARRCARVAFAGLAILAACATLGGPSAWGQQTPEIRLRVGDMIKLEVPQRSELGRTLTIDEKGGVALPLVGTVRLEGLTLEEANAALLRSLQELYPSVQNVTVTLLGEEARRYVYVQGQVARPGKYELAGNPNVWDAVKEAGGAIASAGLEAVRLIRFEGETSTTTIVNLQQAMESGDFKSLPGLKPGDTVIVPERSTTYMGAGSVNVIGAVMRPGPYSMTGERRLVEAILAAGGPTESANLGKVKIIRQRPDGGVLMMEVNFKRYIDKGDIRHNPIVLPNDTVSIPSSATALRTIFTSPTFLVGIITAVGTFITIIVTR